MNLFRHELLDDVLLVFKLVLRLSCLLSALLLLDHLIGVFGFTLFRFLSRLSSAHIGLWRRLTLTGCTL